MHRRGFLGHSLLGSGVMAAMAAEGDRTTTGGGSNANPDVEIERAVEGKPHAGKVLASVAPHSDDHSILCGGTIAKLIREGYTAYLIRTSNDEKDSYDLTLGETVLANERDNREMAKVLGFKDVIDLNYRNHFMDDVSRVELRGRLVFLFQLLKVDTVFSYDPWGHYEENPDHYVTAQAVEAARWIAGGHLDFPEHFLAGLEPHTVTERYYYARGPQWVNRVVDISTTIEQKMAAMRANRTMLGTMVRHFRDELAARKLKIPELEGDEDAAIAAYAEMRFRNLARERGAPYGLEYGERYHYIGPSGAMEEEIAKRAVPL